MAMCEELGLATSVQNQYDDIKYSHKFVEFRLSLGVCNRREHNPRGRTRLRRTNISHTNTSEIALSPRSRTCGSSGGYSARREKYVFKHSSDKLFICPPEADLRTPRTSHIMYVIVWQKPGSCFSKVSVWSSPNNEMQMMRCLGHAQRCLWCKYKAHLLVVFCFHMFMKLKCVAPTHV